MILIHAEKLREGQRVTPYPPAAKHYTLTELQLAVGGFIEILALPNDQLLIVHAEGKLIGLPINHRATTLLVGSRYEGAVVVGDALLCRTELVD